MVNEIIALEEKIKDLENKYKLSITEETPLMKHLVPFASIQEEDKLANFDLSFLRQTKQVNIEPLGEIDLPAYAFYRINAFSMDLDKEAVKKQLIHFHYSKKKKEKIINEKINKRNLSNLSMAIAIQKTTTQISAKQTTPEKLYWWKISHQDPREIMTCWEVTKDYKNIQLTYYHNTGWHSINIPFEVFLINKILETEHFKNKIHESAIFTHEFGKELPNHIKKIVLKKKYPTYLVIEQAKKWEYARSNIDIAYLNDPLLVGIDFKNKKSKLLAWFP